MNFKFKKDIKNAIKRQDLFGHEVKFNFNSKGDVHHTLLGGIASIIIKIMLFWYVGVNFRRLIYHE